jgi:PAS domain S-box-containing protein
VGNGLALAFSDIGDRVRALAAEREARTSRDALLDSMTDAFAAFDDHWRYTYVNRQAEVVLGHPREALLGRVVWEVFPEAREGMAWDSAVTAKREQRLVEYEFYLAPVGKWILARNHPIPGGVSAVFRDVTAEHERVAERERLLAAERSARERAESLARDLEASNDELLRLAAEAETANRAKGEFLAVMSHELRTPLNAIGGYVDLLTMGLRGPVTDEQREDLARIRRSGQHLLALINDILNFARLDAGQVEFRIQDVTLDPVLADLEALVAPQVAAKGLTYAHQGCGAPGTVRADPERLRQILLNLLTNAVKFTDAGGRIAIACDASDRSAVRLHVRDTGRGIPADQLERIFEPFVQVDRNLTPGSQQGVGLGLAISRDLARRMGGDLTAESVRGRGSTFTLVLPRIRGAEALG